MRRRHRRPRQFHLPHLRRTFARQARARCRPARSQSPFRPPSQPLRSDPWAQHRHRQSVTNAGAATTQVRGRQGLGSSGALTRAAARASTPSTCAPSPLQGRWADSSAACWLAAGVGSSGGGTAAAACGAVAAQAAAAAAPCAAATVAAAAPAAVTAVPAGRPACGCRGSGRGRSGEERAAVAERSWVANGHACHGAALPSALTHALNTQPCPSLLPASPPARAPRSRRRRRRLWRSRRRFGSSCGRTRSAAPSWAARR